MTQTHDNLLAQLDVSKTLNNLVLEICGSAITKSGLAAQVTGVMLGNVLISRCRLGNANTEFNKNAPLLTFCLYRTLARAVKHRSLPLHPCIDLLTVIST
jgi:hypothetical protein